MVAKNKAKKKASKKTSAKKVAKKTTKKAKTFTDKVKDKVKKKVSKKTADPVYNFVVHGRFPEELERDVMVVLRPVESVKDRMGQVKVLAMNRDSSFKIWMGGELGDEMLQLLGDHQKKFMWVSQDENGKAVFDPETPVPKELCW